MRGYPAATQGPKQLRERLHLARISKSRAAAEPAGSYPPLPGQVAAVEPGGARAAASGLPRNRTRNPARGAAAAGPPRSRNRTRACDEIIRAAQTGSPRASGRYARIVRIFSLPYAARVWAVRIVPAAVTRAPHAAARASRRHAAARASRRHAATRGGSAVEADSRHCYPSQILFSWSCEEVEPSKPTRGRVAAGCAARRKSARRLWRDRRDSVVH